MSEGFDCNCTTHSKRCLTNRGPTPRVGATESYPLRPVYSPIDDWFRRLSGIVFDGMDLKYVISSDYYEVTGSYVATNVWFSRDFNEKESRVLVEKHVGVGVSREDDGGVSRVIQMPPLELPMPSDAVLDIARKMGMRKGGFI